MSRKHTKRKHYALLDSVSHAILGAAVTDSAALDKLRIRELSAIESFRSGSATKHDWMAVADLLNICETLAHDGVGPEALPACMQAQEALGAAHERYTAGKSLSVTGPELQALRAGYEYHDLQRLSISRARYEQAIKKTADRIKSSHPSIKVCL